MTKQIKVKLHKDPYGEVSDAVFHAIMGGINRYYKHDSKRKMDNEAMREVVHQYVMVALAELIDWEESG